MICHFTAYVKIEASGACVHVTINNYHHFSNKTLRLSMPKPSGDTSA